MDQSFPSTQLLLNKSDLVRGLHSMVGKFIVLRDGAHCVQCGKQTMGVGCGHVIRRGNKATAFDICEDGNNHCQCNKCNGLHETNPNPYNNWYTEEHGKDKFFALNARAQWEIPWKEHLIRELYEQIKTETEGTIIYSDEERIKKIFF